MSQQNRGSFQKGYFGDGKRGDMHVGGRGGGDGGHITVLRRDIRSKRSGLREETLIQSSSIRKS